MTNHIACWTGSIMAVVELGQAESLLQAVGTLSGTGLLVWLVLHKTKERDKDKKAFTEELRELRKENHELSRELGKKCANCQLANAANNLLREAGEERLSHEDEDAESPDNFHNNNRKEHSKK